MSKVALQEDLERSISTAPPSSMERLGGSGVIETSRSPEPLSSAPNPLEQPTQVPTFDVNAMAEAAFRVQGAAVPFDMAVPKRCGGVEISQLGLRAAFLLLHVDGRSSIAEIATMTSISLGEAQKHMRELVALGAVSVDGIARVEIEKLPPSIAPPTRRQP